MKFIRLDLLTLLISLFVLGGCKKDGTVNLGVNDATKIEGNLIDTSSIFVSTVREEDAVTSGLIRTPLSYFKDPLFGVTESNVALDINLPALTAYTLPAGVVTVDSAVLVLPYASGFYGDSITTRYKANVYQLEERLLNAPYTSTKKWKRKTTLLGSQSFFSRTRDSVRVIQPIRGKKDSLMKFAPQLRIPISNAFINDNLFNAPAAQLSSNLIFKNTVNGLYVTLDKSQIGPGGTFMLNMDSAQVRVYIRTKTTTDGVEKLDTTVVELPSKIRAAEIGHDYSGTPIAAEIAVPQKTRDKFYLQGLLGLRAKIQFPYLKDVIKTVGSDIVINRAELVVCAQPGTTFPYEPLRSLMFYRLDLANQRINIQDNTSTDPRATAQYGGFYNPDKKEYHFLVTAYVQDLMRGKVIDYGAYLGAANNPGGTFFNDVSANPQLDGRAAAVGSDGSSPQYRIKLNIIYTKVAK